MPRLRRLFVTHTTALAEDAGSDAAFQLEIAQPGGDVIQRFPSLPHDERERGRTDSYEFDLSGNQVNTDLPGFSVRMRILESSDGWLPKSIFVVGETIEGGRILVGSHPEWQSGWFDSGSGPAGPPAHVISGQ